MKTIRDGETRTTTSTFTQLLSSEEGFSSVLLYVHRDHKAIRDGETRTATSTFTQLLKEFSSLMLLYVRRDNKDF